jgi:NitT/TauT family transport system permease protein
MTTKYSVTLIRVAAIFGAIIALELLCRAGIIDRITMIPPSEMVTALARILQAGTFNEDIAFSLVNTTWAIVLSVGGGFAIGAALHALPRVRAAVEPLLSAYYAVPVFVFYPMLIVIFGIGRTALIVMGAMFGVVAMIVNTLIGLDRVPRAMSKTARIMRLGRLRSLLLVRLPAAGPHLVTGVKLAVAYAVIGIVAGEFILATAGMGKRISFAYNDFDNQTMYGLMLLLLMFVTLLNGLLHVYERRLHQRWGRV